MPDTGSPYHLPYPDLDSIPDIPADFKELAEKVDEQLGTKATRQELTEGLAGKSDDDHSHDNYLTKGTNKRPKLENDGVPSNTMTTGKYLQGGANDQTAPSWQTKNWVANTGGTFSGSLTVNGGVTISSGLTNKGGSRRLEGSAFSDYHSRSMSGSASYTRWTGANNCIYAKLGSQEAWVWIYAAGFSQRTRSADETGTKALDDADLMKVKAFRHVEEQTIEVPVEPEPREGDDLDVEQATPQTRTHTTQRESVVFDIDSLRDAGIGVAETYGTFEDNADEVIDHVVDLGELLARTIQHVQKQEQTIRGLEQRVAELEGDGGA